MTDKNTKFYEIYPYMEPIRPIQNLDKKLAYLPENDYLCTR